MMHVCRSGSAEVESVAADFRQGREAANGKPQQVFAAMRNPTGSDCLPTRRQHNEGIVTWSSSATS